VEQEPQTILERAIILLRASLLPGWQLTAGQRLVWAVRGAIVVGILALIASAVDKTLWNWLDLLIVPVVLAIGGYLFTSSQNQATERASERRAQEDALQGYLDQMSDMLIPNDDQPSLYDARPSDPLSKVARARTLTVLRRLDGVRKARVMQFLIEAALVQASKEKQPIVNLNGADLRGVSLHGAKLRGTNLSDANLESANLSGATLSYANLAGAHLPGANLRGAALRHANMRNTYLVGADLEDAKLEHAILREARLRDANLSRTVLINASMQTAKLKNADLEKAKLANANLTNADLLGTRHITDRMLEEQTGFLKGVRMPGGSKHA
jgi:uncharacterized protein YjbI with pentapeptide repeats